ncbi:MAG: hypothetical protein D6798_12800 [Deltaproteobacteria bacterium]|nr:MAG: hypothetical protein D6798_12800 [Deltaproteobacteria bacterium]
MSSDRHEHLDIHFHRSLAGDLDTHDVETQWATTIRQAEAAVLLGGEIADTLVLFRDDDILSAPVEGMVDEGEERLVAAVLRHILGDDVLGRFRFGERSVPSPEGPRRAAVVLRLPQGDPGWEVRWRFFGETPAGVGTWHSDWHEARGLAIEDAPAWLVDWVDDRRAEVTGQQLHEHPEPPELDIRAARLGPLPLTSEDPRELAEALHASLDREIVHQGLDALLVFVLRADGVLERWELRRIEPFNIDDMIRAICAHAPTTAVALVHPANVTLPDGRALPGIATVVQRAGRQIYRALPIDPRPDGPVLLTPFFQEADRVHTPWIDTPPSVPIELTPLLDDGPTSWTGEVPEA